MVSCVFTENVVFVRLLGSDAVSGGGRELGHAALYGLVTAVVMTLGAALSWLVWRWVLTPLGMDYLQITAFTLIFAGLAALAVAAAGRLMPRLSEALSEQTALTAANCALLGIVVINIDRGYGLADATLSGLFGGLGFALACVCMAGIRERIAYSKVPKPLKGLPISLISASLMALAFMGFTGLGR